MYRAFRHPRPPSTSSGQQHTSRVPTRNLHECGVSVPIVCYRMQNDAQHGLGRREDVLGNCIECEWSFGAQSGPDSWEIRFESNGAWTVWCVDCVVCSPALYVLPVWLCR